MVRIRKEKPVGCELFSTTHATVSYRAVHVASERVRSSGLPFAILPQVIELSRQITDRGMREAGLPPTPCNSCFDKPPVHCPNELSIDPKNINFERLADEAIADRHDRDAASSPAPDLETISDLGAAFGRLTVGDLFSIEELRAMLPKSQD